MKPSSESIKAVFALALQQNTPEGRAQYLAEACQGQPELREQVETLLEAHEQAGAFLAKTMQIAKSDFPAEQPGAMIGRYKVLQQIGEGGCGVVYMAEQQEPVRRRVALKIIKLGMDTKQVIARFEAERQALALMDHPNIAKALDAGATETGRPYFVMELVKGIPITRYCDENNLSTETRLKLFVQICQAVQHAHQKGIIHRDIKPSNVLVADHDGVPVPKIIDFGIAKATTDQRLTDKTLFTAFEQFIGTPAYMSPEQAKLSGLDVDTRSDIYSLGVLLYELLTGKTPFEAKRLLDAGLDEIRRIIREEEPPRPSTRLDTLDAAEQTTVAKHRQADAPKLVHLIRGDLDWIVMKSLEKDRARRYETANGLALDVQRYLNNEPIAARPPSNLYRLQKLVRRNQRTLISATAIFVLAVGVVLLAYPRVKERVKAHLARAALESLVLRPPPWVDGEFMQFDVKVAGVTLGNSRIAIKAATTNGLNIWRLTKDMPGLIGHSVVEARADTFRPIHSHYEMIQDKVMDTSYLKGHAEVQLSGQAESTKIALDGPVFDNEQFFQVVRRLPLKPGYKVALPLLGPGGSVTLWEVEVSGVETVTVPAGTFECFRLAPFAGQTYWYSTDPRRYLVKFEQEGSVVELSAVGESKPIALQPPPWVDGEEMRLDVKVPSRTIGTVRYTVGNGQTNGLNIWRLMMTTSGDFGGPTHSLVEADADTFRPIHSRDERGQNFWEIDYATNYAAVKSSGKDETRKVVLDGPVFDPEQFRQVVRRLPLASGYKVPLPMFNPSGSSPEIQEVEVAGIEEVTVPMGAIKCFRLKSIAGETNWFSADSHHYFVKFQNPYCTLELSGVRQSKAIALQPAPWVDGEEMQFEVKVAGASAGTSRHLVSAGQTNGISIWRLRWELSTGGHVLTEAEADTFRPLHSHIELPQEDIVDISYQADQAEIKTSGKTEIKKAPLDSPVFDNIEAVQLVRRLPLAPGYKVALPLMNPDGVTVIRELEVTGVETLTVPAGTFECFKLKHSDGQTSWFSTDAHHYQVKFEQGKEQGKRVGELSAVRQRTSNE